MKRNAITLQYGGYDAKVISTCLLVALSTIYKWFHDYSVSGEESLTSLKRGRKIGNGRILNPIEEEELQ
ncbi:MAG: hypothetical protein LBR11_08145, partial [Deltaproteobacteria bacterium]|nr:hypothetical protein [Deltaproteobacteria bacterium]